MVRSLLNFLPSVLVMLPLAVAPAESMAQTETMTVDTTDDELNSDGDCSLREAISSANSDTDVDACGITGVGTTAYVINMIADTVRLDLTGGNDNANATGDLDITTTKMVTIQGAGAGVSVIAGFTGDGGEKDRVLHALGGSSVTVEDVTIRDGNWPLATNNAGGGGVWNEGGLVTLRDCAVVDNTATGWGAGVMASGQTIIENCAFSGNTASAGSAVLTTAWLTISNSTFTGNTSAEAGTINVREGAILTMTNSTVGPNTGGGITMLGEESGSTEAAAKGSLIASTIKQSTIAGNSAFGIQMVINALVTVTNATISGNGTNGIQIRPGVTLSVRNSTVAFNTGFGILNEIEGIGGFAELYSSIISNNDVGSAGHDLSGPFTTLGFNVVGNGDGQSGLANAVNNDIVGTTALPVDVHLQPLANNGGPTETHALSEGVVAASSKTGTITQFSPAIDNGDCTVTALSGDQRSFGATASGPRGSDHPLTGVGPGDECDAGSFETVSVQLPVELANFEASVVGSTVRLVWNTATETDNAGFEIEHEHESGRFEPIAFVTGYGTTVEPQSYRYDVVGLSPGRHAFRLRQIDFDGASSTSNTVEVNVELPGRFVLEPAYPNPFNPTATIRFMIARQQQVHVTLHDALGRAVRTLYDGRPASGEMKRVIVDANGLPSGSYIVRLVGEDFTANRSVLLIR